MGRLYDAVLFDLDGTLTLPKVGIVNAVSYALGKYGLTEEDKEKLIVFIGPSLYDSFKQYYNMSGEDAEKCVKYYREYYISKGIFECTVMPGAEDLLKDIESNGIPMYIATGKPTPLAEKVLQNYGLYRYFEAVVGSNFDGTRTHKYEVIKDALPLIKGKKPVMIGDREHDVEGANKNNIDSIAITFGYGKRSDFIKYKATYIVDSMDDIKKIILEK